MSSAGKCRECGAIIPDGPPAGLCGRCLFALALDQEKALPVENQGQGSGAAVRLQEEPDSVALRLDSPSETEAPSVQGQTVQRTDPGLEQPGDWIGHYRLLERIGEGGFGVVYAAEQQEPLQRRVAIKILKPGMDSRQVIARFEAERQALALMDHPNVATVFDAGATATGRPYFVMELVRGVPITQYCDQHHLPPVGRLRLFIQVCQAIQHAHQKGIIHRDIKPSNILVTTEDKVPVLKVIDFGIAKVTQGELAAQTVYTQFQAFLGTPAYMSPEQAGLSGLDVDTRSDIYALGVLLYELLVGRTPFETQVLLEAGLDQMRRTIREKEPARPSTRLGHLAGEEQTTTARRRGTEPRKLIGLLRGDLDWIVMKCLEKDRARRYQTAAGLGRDIERYLSNEAVAARPPSKVYRLQKLLRRNKLLFTAAAVVVAVLLLGILVSLAELVRARRAEREQGRLHRGEQAALYQSRLSENRALRQARLPGWSTLAMQNLQSNVALPFPGRDLVELRSEAVACFEGLDAVELARLPSGAAYIRSLDFSPNGATLASADDDCKLSLWNVAGQRLLWETNDPASRITDPHDPTHTPTPLIRFHPGAAGNLLVYSTWGASVEVAPTAQPRNPEFRVSTAEFARGVAFDRKGAILAVAWAGRPAVVYEAVTGKVLRDLPPTPGTGQRECEVIALSADGKLLALAGEGNAVTLCRLDRETPPVVLGWHQGIVTSLAFSADGKLLLSASFDHTAKLFDVQAGKELFAFLGHKARVTAAVFRPDGRVAATVSDDQTARLWDVRAGEPLLILRPREASLMSAAFAPDGQTLAIASRRIILYRLTSEGAKQVLFGHSYFVHSLAFHPTDPVLASAAADNRILFWDVLDGTPTARLPGYVEGGPCGLAFTPDGQRLAAGHRGFSGQIPTGYRPRLWKLPPESPPETLTGHDAGVPFVAIDATGELLASGDDAGTVIVRKLGANGWQTRWGRADDKVNGLGFVSPGPALATAYLGGHVELRDARTGKILAETQFPSKIVMTVSALGNQVVVATETGAIKVLTLPQLTLAATLEPPRKDRPSSPRLACTAEGRTLAVGGLDGRVALYDTVAATKLLDLPPQEAGVYVLAFDATGAHLAIGGVEEQVTVWNLQVVRQRLRGLGLDWGSPAGLR